MTSFPCRLGRLSKSSTVFHVWPLGRVNIQDIPCNNNNGAPFTSQERTERRKRIMLFQTLGSLSLHLSIISPHLSDPAGHADSAHILLQLRYISCLQPLFSNKPISNCSTRPGCALGMNLYQSTWRLALSSQIKLYQACLKHKNHQMAADSKASMCHLLPCVNSVRCHPQSDGIGLGI